MAFVKEARASIIQPKVSGRSWAQVRTAAKAQAEVSDNLVARASEILGKPFSPKEFLLTHATIVASVDTYEPPNAKLGSVMEGGFRVNRKYANYRVKLGSDKFINNNLDCWDRDVLLKSFRTFIGGHNFVEHVQVEEMSRGRIIDAVARDVGESVYIDILIATDRKHADLVAAIESGKMTTLSMGCTVDGTICTKCGHWAADETEMCPHIKYEKGNTFFDDQGRQHRVAELCGHGSLDPTGGVIFIEGSWVGTPAFTGAVLRNVIALHPGEELGKAASAILDIPPDQWTKDTRRKVAMIVSNHFMAGWDDEDEGGGDEEEAPAEESKKNPFEDMENELTDHMRGRVKKKLKKDMDEQDADEALGPEDSSTAPNDNLVKQSELMMDDLVPDQHRKAAYGGAVSYICRTASSDADLMNRVAGLNEEYEVRIPIPLYRAALRLGSVGEYDNANQFVRACQAALGRKPTTAEAKVLFRLGKLIPQRGQARSGVASSSLAVARTKENVR
jgi:hypothetical protein